ncbi:MAG: HTH domain-containing protein, partial [Dorea sp.]|nr:HTH domain-containing protein [Dorea sp.]
MRESRLFRIVYYLLQNGKATAPELAQKFEVSIRTIYRDID